MAMADAQPFPQPSTGVGLIEPADDILYNDCDPSHISDLRKTMRPHGLRAFETEPSAPAWADEGFHRRRVYIRTLDDACNSVFFQDSWLAKSKVKWDVFDLKTGHMPFIIQPDALAARVAKSIHKFLDLQHMAFNTSIDSISDAVVDSSFLSI